MQCTRPAFRQARLPGHPFRRSLPARVLQPLPAGEPEARGDAPPRKILL